LTGKFNAIIAPPESWIDSRTAGEVVSTKFVNYIDTSELLRYGSGMAIENHQLVDIIRRRQGERTLRAFAQSLQIQPTYLSEVLNGIRPVGATLASQMGYTRVKTTHIRFAKKAK
jgi:hypothetical protein